MTVYSGKVIAIEKDANFLNKKIAEVKTESGSMFFFVKKMKVAVGNKVDIHKEENQMMYQQIIIK